MTPKDWFRLILICASWFKFVTKMATGVVGLALGNFWPSLGMLASGGSAALVLVYLHVFDVPPEEEDELEIEDLDDEEHE